MVRFRPADPWRDPDFVRFWAGESISLVGSQVTALALPLTAVLLLGATPAQMGMLVAFGYMPFLAITLPAGVWIDRRRRRPVLIVANLCRASIVAIVPIAAVLGVLRIEWLYVIAFAAGLFTVAFEVGFLAYVPSLVPRDQLTTANGRLQASASAAQVGGPGLAGILVSMLGAPLALLVDAASYLVSAVSLATIQRRELEPAMGTKRKDMIGEVREGLRMTFGHPVLRAFAAEAATYNALWQIVEVLLILYLTRTFGLDAATIGVLFAVAAVGSLVGSLLAGPLAARLGLGPTIVGSMVVGCAAPILMPLATGPAPLALVMLGAAMFLGSLGVGVSNVHVVSIRQTVTPAHLLGRMNASYRTVVWGAIPIGALFGGALGELIGLRAAIAVASVGLLFVPLWVIRSPVPAMWSLPRADDGAAAVAA